MPKKEEEIDRLVIVAAPVAIFFAAVLVRPALDTSFDALAVSALPIGDPIVPLSEPIEAPEDEAIVPDLAPPDAAVSLMLLRVADSVRISNVWVAVSEGLFTVEL